MGIYGTRAEADTYFGLRDFEGKWATFSNDQKDKALQVATDQVDRLEYAGQRFSGTEQLLAFPRILDSFASREQRVWDVDFTTGDIVVPEKVRRATFEQANHLLATLSGSELSCKLREGLTSISIGSTSESYDLSRRDQFVSRRTSLVIDAKDLLEEYILRWY